LFVPEPRRIAAYDDTPLPIGYKQTISQPYIVALMLEALELTGSERVLEIGTGSGYQAALLSQLAKNVYSVEIIPELAQAARTVLAQLDYENVEVVTANGSVGWKVGAPYAAIVITAASPDLLSSLLEQLQEDGRLVVPVGELFSQHLLRVRKRRGEAMIEDLGTCAFVPLVGRAGWQLGL
jgi:protein-L-isoaspartate(D-aspartate) O-methyltransferase